MLKRITKLKKIITLLITGLILSSCQLVVVGTTKTLDALDNATSKIKSEREYKATHKKDGPKAFENKKYKEDVKEVIKDIAKRPINKGEEFGGVTIFIPENTKLNKKYGNIIDEKTGYGIPLWFKITDYCTKLAYRKQREDTWYVTIFCIEASELNSINIIEEKIAKTNGFTKTCK